MAPRRRFKGQGGGLEKSIASQLAKDINKVVAASIQESAVAIANGLVEAGPAWSGEFAASWDVILEGESSRTSRSFGDSPYVYTRRNFPRSRFEKALNSNKSKFSIVNLASHAAEAIDQDRAIFTRPNNDPVKTPELGMGRDNPSFRYEIGGPFSGSLEEAPAARTAEPDWFYTYIEGGPLKGDLRRGVELAFKTNYSFSE